MPQYEMNVRRLSGKERRRNAARGAAKVGGINAALGAGLGALEGGRAGALVGGAIGAGIGGGLGAYAGGQRKYLGEIRRVGGTPTRKIKGQDVQFTPGPRGRLEAQRVTKGVFGSAKRTVENTERATRSMADSAEELRRIIPTPKQAKLLAAGGAGAVTVGPGVGSYYGSKRGTKAAARQQSMQRVGKRGEWKTIEDLKDDRRDGRQRQRQGGKILGAGVGLGATAYKMGGGVGGLKQEIRNIGTAYRFGGAIKMPPGQRAALMGRTMGRNLAGTAAIGAGLTVATGGTVNGIGGRQARAADQRIKARRQANYRRQQERSQLLHVRKADDMAVARYGNGSSRGRKITDLSEPLVVEKAFRLKDPLGLRKIKLSDPGTLSPDKDALHQMALRSTRGSTNAGLLREQRAGRSGTIRNQLRGNGIVTKRERQFSPEDRRRYAQGRTAGAATVAGAGALAYGGREAYREGQRIRKLPLKLSGLNNEQKVLVNRIRGGKFVALNGRAAAGLGGGAALLAGAQRQGRRARSDRNRTWG